MNCITYEMLGNTFKHLHFANAATFEISLLQKNLKYLCCGVDEFSLESITTEITAKNQNGSPLNSNTPTVNSYSLPLDRPSPPPARTLYCKVQKTIVPIFITHAFPPSLCLNRIE